MILGGISIALFARCFSRSLDLGTLIVLSYMPDLVHAVFLFFGLESQVYSSSLAAGVHPYTMQLDFSHSMISCAGQSFMSGMVSFGFFISADAAFIATALPGLHCAFDLISHRSAIRIIPWYGPAFGLGLWNYPILASILDFGLFLLGTVIFARKTKLGKSASGFLIFGIILFVVRWALFRVSLPMYVHAIQILATVFVMAGWGRLSDYALYDKMKRARQQIYEGIEQVKKRTNKSMSAHSMVVNELFRGVTSPMIDPITQKPMIPQEFQWNTLDDEGLNKLVSTIEKDMDTILWAEGESHLRIDGTDSIESQISATASMNNRELDIAIKAALDAPVDESGAPHLKVNSLPPLDDLESGRFTTSVNVNSVNMNNKSSAKSD